MRIKLPGIASATKRLANGKTQKYYYAWRGGPLLKDDEGRPLKPDTLAFKTAYDKAMADRKTLAKGTLFSVIAEYRASADYLGKAPKTRKDYARYLKLIEEEFGTTPLKVVEDIRMRGDFMAWRDKFLATPRTADYAWTMLARVLSFAKNRGRITVNVCERGGRLYEADRAEKIWEAGHIAAFRAKASPELWQALMMALWTGQREGDLLRLSWKAFDGTHIRLRQRKTGVRVTIPVGQPLKETLDALRAQNRAATTILTNSRFHKPWTEDGFRTSWGKACAKAGIVDLTFHDLRGTAVTRLAVAGCTVPEIAAITGHSLADVESILNAHYLGGRVELAEAAIEKMDKAYGNGT